MNHTVENLRTSLADLDRRREAIERQLNARTVGAAEQMDPSERARLQRDLNELSRLRSATAETLAEAERHAQAEKASRDQRRDAVIADSAEIMKTITDASRHADDLARDLCRALAQRRQAIEALEPLLGQPIVKQYINKSINTHALGKAGLRDFAMLGNAPEGDSHSLKTHAELIVRSSLQREILRLKSAKAA